MNPTLDKDWQDLDAFRRTRDPQYFGRLYERHCDDVGRFALGLTRRPEVAEEAVAEAWARVAAQPPNPHRSFRAFLFTVVRRLCIDGVRRQKTADRNAPALARRTPPPSLERQVVRRDTAFAVQAAVAELPPKHREVLLLYYGQDLTSVEVAQVLDCTDQQVRSRLAYARRLLRDLLESRKEAL